MPLRNKRNSDLLYIDQYIPKESKVRQKNVAKPWIDYKKVYDYPTNLDI